MRSILLTKHMRGTLYLSAWRQTVSVWGSTPATPSNTATAPSSTRSERSTSTVKSTWPGVSMIWMRCSSPVDGVLPERSGGSRRDRDAALLLLLHPVHRGGALVDLTDLVGLAGVVEDPLGGRRLARVDVGHDADVAGALEWELRHCSSRQVSGDGGQVRWDTGRPDGSAGWSPAVVGEGAVGLGHLVEVFLALDRSADAVAGVEQLVRPGARTWCAHAADGSTRRANGWRACWHAAAGPRRAPGRWHHRPGGSSPRAGAWCCRAARLSVTTGSVPVFVSMVVSAS